MENTQITGTRKRPVRTVCSKLMAPFKELYHVFRDDIGLKMLFSDAKNTLKRAGSFVLGNAMVLPFYVLGHEAIHAASYKLLGKGVDYLGLRKELGGGLLEKIFPFISSNVNEFEENVLGAAGSFMNGSPLESLVGSSAPFILTPLGIMLMRKAGKQGSRFREGIGFLIATAPLRNPFDFCSISGALGLEGIEKHLAAGALMASAYVGSYYIANGLEALLKKIKKDKKVQEKEEKPERLRGILSSAKHLAAVALVSLSLAYVGQPDHPMRIPPKQKERNTKEVQDLYNTQQYERTLELVQQEPVKFQKYPEQFRKEIKIMAYAALISRGQRTEETALSDIPPELHNRFYFHLLLLQVSNKEYAEARKTSEKIDRDKLNDNEKQTVDYHRDIIHKTLDTKSF
jgi:hypothetical protein